MLPLCNSGLGSGSVALNLPLGLASISLKVELTILFFISSKNFIDITKWSKSINDSGTTIILTTHYLEEAENLCRNVAIIDEGIIIQDTSMNKLLRQLKQETIILTLEDSISVMPKIGSFECSKIDSQNIEVVIDSEHKINELFGILNKQNINISSMRNKANRLEELFLKVVENKK